MTTVSPHASCDGARPDILLDAVVRFLGDRPLLVLDGLGRLIWLSPRACDQLGARFQPPRDLVLAVREAAASPHLQSQVSQTTLDAQRVVLHVVTHGQGTVVIAELVLGEHLSAAETRVYDAIGQGLSNADIAERLHLSVATVKTHVHRILAKLGVRSRLEAALLARSAS